MSDSTNNISTGSRVRFAHDFIRDNALSADEKASMTAATGTVIATWPGCLLFDVQWDGEPRPGCHSVAMDEAFLVAIPR
jgi:hypothetical protein